MGLGAMTWGQPTGLARWTPAQLAYGPSHGTAEEEQALAVSLASGVNLIDTAEMYSAGASERRVGELAQGKPVVVATKFPPSPFSRTESFPRRWPAAWRGWAAAGSICTSITFHPDGFRYRWLMNRMADAVEAGQVKAMG
jgi:aryl-alcohol dehydrogenase-like predicted oxidoreductase